MKQSSEAWSNSGEMGFTVQELIVVVVLIGILAAMALPKYGALPSAAADANAQTIAGAFGAAAANYTARCAVNNPGAGVPCAGGIPSPALACDRTTLGLLVSGIDTATYTVGGTPAGGCTIRKDGGTVAYTTARIAP